MTFALNCILRADAMPALVALRADHLAYIREHRDEILFGGPARGDSGIPEEMIIVLRTSDRAAAEGFLRAEPYHASGRVFSQVRLRAWSQVMPEVTPGALDAALAEERAKRAR